MAIISVSGKINSGKDTVGKIIQYLCSRENATFQSWSIAQNNCKSDIVNKFYQGGWEIVKWADKLKDMVCILLNCTREQLEDRVFKETELGEEWWYYKCGNLFDGYELYNYKNESYEYLVTLYNKSNVELIKPTPRLLLQLLDTECGRNILHPNVWVNATMNDYFCSIKTIEGELKVQGSDWIITDTRFPNEANAVKSRGGINIRVNRTQEAIYNYCDNIYNLKDLFAIVHKDTGEYPLKVYADEHWLIKPSEHESETALDNYTFDYVIDNNGTIEDLIIKVKEILIKEQII